MTQEAWVEVRAAAPREEKLAPERWPRVTEERNLLGG